VYSRGLKAVLRIRIRDPESDVFFASGSGIQDEEKIKIRIRDENFGSYFRELRNNFLGLKYLNSWCGSGSGIRDNLDRGWKKFRSGIRDKYPGSATLA
jgi:hypothetical protein